MKLYYYEIEWPDGDCTRSWFVDYHHCAEAVKKHSTDCEGVISGVCETDIDTADSFWIVDFLNQYADICTPIKC